MSMVLMFEITNFILLQKDTGTTEITQGNHREINILKQKSGSPDTVVWQCLHNLGDINLLNLYFICKVIF